MARLKIPTFPATPIIPDMSLVDLIYMSTGVRVRPGRSIGDHETQMLVASLLVMTAKSDGGISPDESVRMVELLRNRFHLKSGEALNMITRISDDLTDHTNLDEILEFVDEELSLAQKEDLMLMVLGVIAADHQKDAAEMTLLAGLIEGLKIPDNIMTNVYARYFVDRS